MNQYYFYLFNEYFIFPIPFKNCIFVVVVFFKYKPYYIVFDFYLKYPG